MPLIGASNSLGGLTGSNALARLLVVISGDSSQLTTALASSEGKLSGFAKNAGAIGNALTRNVTLPFLAIGGAAVKAAADFNAALTRVAALTPILEQSGQSFEELENHILDLANQPDIVATPTELANALYFAGSAGLAAADAFQVVELAAKGQTVGMGESADIAKVLIFAMNNYKDEALTAADAMDALTVAVREGTAEPQELAIALGRLLPVAHQAGVSFQEVVASVAALTNLGVPARVATTSLRALFGGLLAPTKQSTEALNELGITADQLRVKLQQGPLEAFQLLTDAVHGNYDQLHLLIPQIRAITAFYGLSGTQLKKYNSIIQNTTHSQGALQTVVDQFIKTPTFKFQKALQQLGIAGIELGNELLPVFTTLVGVIQDIAEVFISLPGPVKAAVASFLTLGAAVGPALKLFAVISAFGEGGVAAMKALAAGFVTAGVAAGVAAGGFLSLIHGSSSLVSIGSTLIGTFLAMQLAVKGVSLAFATMKSGVNVLVDTIATLSGGEIIAIAAGIAAIVTVVALLAGGSARAAAKLNQFGEAMVQGANQGQSLRDTLRQIKDVDIQSYLTKLAESLRLLDKPTNLTLKGLETGVLNDVISKVHELSTAVGTNAAGFGDYDTSLRKVDDALQKAAGGGLPQLIAAFDKAGTGSKGFAGELSQIGVIATELSRGHSPITGLSEEARNLIGIFQESRGIIDEYNTAQLGTAIAYSQNESAVQRLARETGVSTEFMQNALTRTGNSAVFLDEKSKHAFLDAAGFIDHKTGEITASVQEMRQAIDEEAQAISDSFQGMFDAFSKPESDPAPQFSVLLSRMIAVRNEALQTSNELVELGRRGVPTELLDELVSQGPAAIHRFAQATDKELDNYVRAFEIQMAAGDAEVLKEGVHLQKKAKDNIRGFTEAILTQKGLSRDAGRQIILEVSDGLASGHLHENAFVLIENFVAGLRDGKKLTNKQATAISLAFVKELEKPKNFTKAGELIPRSVAAGIAAQTHLPVAVIQEVMDRVVNGIRSRKQAAKKAAQELAHETAQNLGDQIAQHRAYDSGRDLGSSFARGIQESGAFASAYANNVARQAAAAFEAGLYGSPRYASYYQGQDYAKAFSEGMKNEGIDVSIDINKLKRETDQGIQDFLASILENRGISQRAGRDIILSVADGLVSGDLGPAAIRLISTFTDTLDRQGVGETKDKAGQLAGAFVDALKNQANYDDAGRLIPDAVARGIAQNTHTPIGEVNELMRGVVRAIGANLGDVDGAARGVSTSITRGLEGADLASTGQSMMDSAADGVKRGMSSPIAAILDMAHRSNIAMLKNLQGVEVGRDFARQFGQGVKSEGLDVDLTDTTTLRRSGEQGIQSFVDGMLSNRAISQQAAGEILNSVADGLRSRTLRPDALFLISTFTNSLGQRGVRLTKRKADEISIAFVNQLKTKENYTSTGRLIVSRVAEGIAAATDIPVAKARLIVASFSQALKGHDDQIRARGHDIALSLSRGIEGGRFDVRRSGISLMTSLGEGIKIGTGGAASAAAEAAAEVKRVLDRGLHSSPKYSSYYMGQEYARQFSEGMRSVGINKDDVVKGLGRVHTTLRNSRKARRDIRLDVRLDRAQTARDLDYEYRARGE